MNIRFVMAALFLSVAATHQIAAAADRPNLILIVVDDLSQRTLGCTGDRIVQTPNIDRLAADGALFRNAFVTTSICWTSRASMFTGQWVRRHHVDASSVPLVGQAWDNTYPAQLRRAGYRTGFIGKFGVGSAKEIAAKQDAFDFWRGLPGQAGMFFDDNDLTHTHKTARFGNEALEFLAGCKPEQPFCLSLSFNAVHARDHQPREYTPDARDEQLYENVPIPLSALATDEAFRRLPPFVQKCEGRVRWAWRFDEPEKAQRILRDYYRLITGVDREVGRIMAALAEQKLADNTVVIFTSDNGYTLGDRGMADKWFMYEEDIRVPLIVYDPRLPAAARGRKLDEMVLNVDLAPTLCDLARVPVPSTMQGRSLEPLLAGKEPSDWRSDFFYEHHFRDAAKIPPVEGVRTKSMAYMRWTDAQPVVEELYDLAKDPQEEHNLIADSAYAQALSKLRSRWAELCEAAK